VARLICEAQPGDVACHHCDEPACVNPEHIYRGTRKSNMEDKVRRGRARSTGGRTRLLPGAVQAIREDERMHKLIAPDYGVSVSLISQIKRGEKLRAVF
jgi:hypothetical protein